MNVTNGHNNVYRLSGLIILCGAFEIISLKVEMFVQVVPVLEVVRQGSHYSMFWSSGKKDSSFICA
jgi:hypothetical protein